MKLLSIILLSLTSLSHTSVSADKIIKDSITSQSKKRVYYLFVPESVNSNTIGIRNEIESLKLDNRWLAGISDGHEVNASGN
jgi:hypothetical protein